MFMSHWPSQWAATGLHRGIHLPAPWMLRVHCPCQGASSPPTQPLSTAGGQLGVWGFAALIGAMGQLGLTPSTAVPASWPPHRGAGRSESGAAQRAPLQHVSFQLSEPLQLLRQRMKLRWPGLWRPPCSPSCSLAVLWPPCFPFERLRSHRGALEQPPGQLEAAWSPLPPPRPRPWCLSPTVGPGLAWTQPVGCSQQGAGQQRTAPAGPSACPCASPGPLLLLSGEHVPKSRPGAEECQESD